MVSFPMAKHIFVVVLGLISASEQCENSCPEGWKGINDRCFKYFLPKKSWAQAESYCVALGGNLASVHSAEEHQFLKDLNKAADPHTNPISYWIGLTDSQKEGTWLWTDGSQVDYTGWYNGEPNNAGNREDCVHIFYTKQLWNDVPCRRTYSFICVKREV